MSAETVIREKLQAGLNPARIELLNVSARHKGHAGDDGSGESHFELLVVAEAFAGKPRLERHRMVNELLKAELSGRIHALAVKAYSPAEYAGME
jgi:BolA protein